MPRRWTLLAKVQRLCRPQGVERGPAVCGCGHPATNVDSVAIHLQHAEGMPSRAGVSGVYRCGSPWLCPVCSTSAARDRAGRVQAVAEATYARGGAVALVVLTASHDLSTSLADGKRLVAGASGRARKGRAWVRMREALGILGVVVGQEVTLGRKAGWHYHQHLCIPIDGPLKSEVAAAIDRAGARIGPVTREEASWDAPAAILRAGTRIGPVTAPECSVVRVRAEAAGRAVAEAYKAQIRKVGGTVSDEHGCFSRVADDADDASLYTAKGSAAWEVAGGHKTETRSKLSLTPWAIAEAAYAGDAWCRARWSEYAEAMPGTRSCVVSASLAKTLGLAASDDEEPGEQVVHEQDGVVGRLSSVVWRSLIRQALAGTFLGRLETVSEAEGEVEGFEQVQAWAIEVTAEDVRQDQERRDLALLPSHERWTRDPGSDRMRQMTPEEQHAAVEARRAEVREMGDLRREVLPPPPVETLAAARTRIAAENRARAIEKAVRRVGDIACGPADTRDRLARACADVAAACPGEPPPTPADLLRLVRLAA